MRKTEKVIVIADFGKMKGFYDTLYGDVRKRQKMVGIGILGESAELL